MLLIGLALVAALILAIEFKPIRCKKIIDPKRIQIVAQNGKQGQHVLLLHYIEVDTGRAGVAEVEENRCVFHFSPEYDKAPYIELALGREDIVYSAECWLPVATEIQCVGIGPAKNKIL